MIEQDSISSSPELSSANVEVQAKHHDGYHSPREILSWLPKTATPWQQDSAIRANYKFPEVDWSMRPNPMCTPTTRADKPSEFTLGKPMYHGRSMVQPDSVYRPEAAPYRQGVAGDPVPYSIAGDNLITSILIGCFIMAMVSIAKSGNFIQRQVKNFFHIQREGTTVITETGSEVRFQVFLLIQTGMLLALIYFFHSKVIFGESFICSNYQIIGVYTGIITAYFIVKSILYSIINWVFFDRKKNEQWMKSLLFLVSIEGIVLFPIVMLLAYFNISIESTVIYTGVVIILAKLLVFYKTFIIFFHKNSAIVQSFLYFCAFEVMPLGVLWGALMLTNNYLKVNF